jgi:eukaryotic-like serine/threonine-protein kinase
MIPTSYARTSAAAIPRPAAELTLHLVKGWELVGLIGEGALARVYEARPAGQDLDCGASYALKLLKSPWDQDPRGLELLAREARVGRKASHPHLVPILAANLDEPPYFVVMPRLEGHPLTRLIGAVERPSVTEALWIARQVAEALGALDALGWMHADVKPGNIFVSPTAHVTLIDLGLAQRAGAPLSVYQRPVVGTLAYMAPETTVSTLAADIRSDIYSLGVTLFQILTGRLPFDAQDAARLLEQHRQELPADLRVLAPHLPTRVARLIRQMLAKEPLRRPQTPCELVERLAALEIETFADRGPL